MSPNILLIESKSIQKKESRVPPILRNWLFFKKPNAIPCISLAIKKIVADVYSMWGCVPLFSAIKSKIKKIGAYSIRLPCALTALGRASSP